MAGRDRYNGDLFPFSRSFSAETPAQLQYVDVAGGCITKLFTQTGISDTTLFIMADGTLRFSGNCQGSFCGAAYGSTSPLKWVGDNAGEGTVSMAASNFPSGIKEATCTDFGMCCA